MKKIRVAALLMVVVMMMSLCTVSLFDTGRVMAAENKSQELMVFGNKVVIKDSPQRVIRLSGVNIPGGEWTGTPGVEKIDRSSIVAIDDWDCNVLRLAVGTKGWFGEYSYASASNYQNSIDNVIQLASARGAYVILDFHHYKGFDNAKYLQFWREAAVKYKNNPTVLFGILNEPHGISWEQWRNGGGAYTGHQQVVEMIRDLGAKNIIVAAGLDWGYNLSGIAEGYALVDQGSDNNKDLTGNGIIYDTHIYPWKGRTSNWHGRVGATRMEHPVLVGECGWDEATNKSVGGKVYQPGDVMYHDKWVPELLNWIDDIDTYGNYANYTAYSFHPSSAPRMLDNSDDTWKNADYAYTPTEYWGAYVKDFLKDNISTRYTVLGAPAKIGIRDPRLYYQVGDEFDIQNGFIMAYDELGNFYEVPFNDTNASFSGFDSTKPVQSQTVTVNYMGTTAKFDVNIAASMNMGTAAPKEIEKKYLSVDFEDATETANGLNYSFDMTNKADNSSYNVQTYSTLEGTRSKYRIQGSSNKYLMAPSKAAASYNIPMPSAITKADGRVYVDMRLYRPSLTDDAVTLSVTDSSDKIIFALDFAANAAPTLVASQDYSNVNYPAAAGWRYMRAIINFDMKTFELYQGESFDNLANMVTGVDSFSFKDTTAVDLARFTNHGIGSSEGSLGFDDIDVYTVATEPKYVWPLVGIDTKDVVTNYRTYDEFNSKVGKLLLTYGNGIIKEIPLATDGVTISGFDSMIDGAQTVTIEYQGHKTTVDVFVAHYTYMIGISAVGLREIYEVGDTLDKSKGELHLEYADGTYDALPVSNAGVTINGFNSNTTGKKTLTLQYGSFKTEFVITVVPDVSSITVTGLKSSYSSDEPIDYNNTRLNISYVDGTSGTIRLDEDGVSVVKRANTTTNKVTVVVTYKSKRYTHTADLVPSIYDWQISVGTITNSTASLATTVTLSGGTKNADLIVYAKDTLGQVISVGVYPITVGMTSCEVLITSDGDTTDATLHCVMWDSAKTMDPVSYMIKKAS